MIIIGAGLCGLTAAFLLKKKHADIYVFEKEKIVGGNAKTLIKKGYFFDLTGHAFHLVNEEVRSLIFDELKLKDSFNLVSRNSAVHINGTFIPYPFQYNLKGLDKEHRDNAIIDFLEARYAKNELKPSIFTTFYEYSISTLGKTITSLFMQPYNEKLWACSTNELGIDWMGKFVPQPDVEKILYGAFIGNDNQHEGYNASFYYPREGGIGLIAEALSKELRDEICFLSEVTAIDLEKRQVIINDERKYQYEVLINTMPLNLFLRLSNRNEEYCKLDPTFAIIDVFIISIPANRMPYTWVYLPSREYKSYRIGNFSRFSPSLHRKRDLLYVEVSRSSNKPDKKTSYASVLEDVIKVAQTLKIEIDLISSFTIDPGYVVYNLRRKEALDGILSALWSKYGVISTGRYGGWKYDSMEGAIKDGIDAVKVIRDHVKGIENEVAY